MSHFVVLIQIHKRRAATVISFATLFLLRFIKGEPVAPSTVMSRGQGGAAGGLGGAAGGGGAAGSKSAPASSFASGSEYQSGEYQSSEYQSSEYQSGRKFLPPIPRGYI